MLDDQDPLTILVYAPPPLSDYDRVLAIVQSLERSFPGLRLAWDVTEEGQLIALARRDEWIAEALARGDFPFLCNGDETFPVIITGHAISAESAPGGRPWIYVDVSLPLEASVIAAGMKVMEGLGYGARAFWGVGSPQHTAALISRQTKIPPISHPGVEDEPRPPKGLPEIRTSRELPSPEIPQRLGWLNYWSAVTVQLLGFPDPARDADLLARARRTPAGAWVVQLTDAPLDLDIPEHLDVLRRTYDRFPLIGGRSLP